MATSLEDHFRKARRELYRAYIEERRDGTVPPETAALTALGHIIATFLPAPPKLYNSAGRDAKTYALVLEIVELAGQLPALESSGVWKIHPEPAAVDVPAPAPVPAPARAAEEDLGIALTAVATRCDLAYSEAHTILFLSFTAEQLRQHILMQQPIFVITHAAADVIEKTVLAARSAPVEP